MFRTEKDEFGEDVIFATFGHGTIALYPAMTPTDQYTLFIRDSCNTSKPGEKIPHGFVDLEGTRIVFEFENMAGLNVLIEHLEKVRDLMKQHATYESVMAS